MVPAWAEAPTRGDSWGPKTLSPWGTCAMAQTNNTGQGENCSRVHTKSPAKVHSSPALTCRCCSQIAEGNQQPCHRACHKLGLARTKGQSTAQPDAVQMPQVLQVLTRDKVTAVHCTALAKIPPEPRVLLGPETMAEKDRKRDKNWNNENRVQD